MLVEGPGVWCLELGYPESSATGIALAGFGEEGRPLTWLGHRPLFALKQDAGCRQLTDTCQVGGPGTELIEMAFAKVADLEEQKHRLRAEAGGKREEQRSRRSVGRRAEQGVRGALMRLATWVCTGKTEEARGPEVRLGLRTPQR